MNELSWKPLALALSACVHFAALNAAVPGEQAQCGGLTNGSCLVIWTPDRLKLGNGVFSRVFRPGERGLETVSLKVGGRELLHQSCGRNALQKQVRFIRVTASAQPLTLVGKAGVRIVASSGDWTEALSLAEGMDGIVREATRLDFRFVPTGDVWQDMPREDEAWRAGADSMRFAWPHAKVVAYELHDQTDVNDEKLFKREWLPTTLAAPQRLDESIAAVEDVLTGAGVAFARLAPLHASRPCAMPDYAFTAAGNRLTFAAVRNGWPVAEIAYVGGVRGRTRALHSMQRALRDYRADRDGLLVSNTWGDSNADRRINADFIAAEVRAAGRVGVDVVQIDDGWQRGKSINSLLLRAGEKGKWGNFRENAQFWKVDPVRFPDGLGALVKLARERSVELGLWFGPDSTHDCAACEEDAETLLEFYRVHGIRYFKIDSLEMSSEAAFANQRRFFDRLLRESHGAIVSDFDVTGVAKRPGYFGLPDVGPIFLENRMWKRGHYWPHQTLRSLWSLAEVVDPMRLRVEFLNPHHGAGEYPADSPLSPAHYRVDALFAIAMVASPLAWMELSELDRDSAAELRQAVDVWKSNRERLHSGITFPIGENPDGVAWTVFATCAANGRCGFVLLFRELNENAGYEVDLSALVPSARAANVIAGNGTAKLVGKRLAVGIPRQLDYLWIELK